MFAVQVGLSGRAAKAQARYLAKEREAMLRARDRATLADLRQLITQARRRRKEALSRAVGLCKRARAAVREQIRAFRAKERERINLEVANVRLGARTRCAQRKDRIRGAAQTAQERARRRVAEERRLQVQLRRAEGVATAKRARLSSAKERRQEADGEVRGNLPAELRPVWDRVKKSIKPGLRTTRTEAFLEWAEANPGEVIALESQNAEREVAELVAAYEAAAGAPKRRLPKSELRALEKLGLAKTRPEAKRHAVAAGVDDYVPF